MINVKTYYCEEKIIQDTVMDDIEMSGTIGVVTQKIINIQDAGIKEALIRLGWTPPEHTDNSVNK